MTNFRLFVYLVIEMILSNFPFSCNQQHMFSLIFFYFRFLFKNHFVLQKYLIFILHFRNTPTLGLMTTLLLFFSFRFVFFRFQQCVYAILYLSISSRMHHMFFVNINGLFLTNQVFFQL